MILAVVILTRWPELEGRAVNHDSALALDPPQRYLVPGAVVHPVLRDPHLQRTLAQVDVQVQVAPEYLEREQVRLRALGKVYGFTSLQNHYNELAKGNLP